MRGRKIYTLDDDPVVTELLGLKLTECGHEITSLAEAQTAIALIRQAPPDLLILDLNMPEAGGLEVLATLRSHGLLPQVRVLLLTGDDNMTTIGHAIRLGAAAYLLKPFTTKDLLARIEDLLPQSAKTTTPAPTPTTLAGINQVVTDLLSAYGTTAVGRLLSSLAGQLERLERKQGAAPTEIALEAHAIKGAAGSLGFLAVSGACNALEMACLQGSAVERARSEAAQACAIARQQINTYLHAAA